MSHTLSLQLSLTDLDALAVAAGRCGALVLGAGAYRLFEGKEAIQGVGVQLEGWNFPVIVCSDGSIKYDNMEGAWGAPERLHDLVAYYGLEAARSAALRAGHSCYESISDGALVLTVQMGV